jgi:hypothetical protein
LNARADPLRPQRTEIIRRGFASGNEAVFVLRGHAIADA